MNVVTAIWGDKYDERYVTALRNQVPGLIVLGRDRPLREHQKYRGWWCKLEVFAPWNRELRPCLFLDLDTFVFRGLSEVRNVDPDTLWLIKNFYLPEKSNSGLFVAPATELSDRIFHGADRLDTRSFGRGPGDGDYLATFPHKRLTDEFDDILSYKKDQLYDSPKNARICVFHGFPKPHECKGWAKDFFDARSTG